jgi:hypothetical protein
MNAAFDWQDLVATVGGDLEAFTRLLRQPPDRLDSQKDSLPQLIVTKVGLLRVLLALQHKDASPELVQQWASFIRRGYFGSEKGHRCPIEIQYDPSMEDQIVEVLARLDELGDLVDGEITDIELSEMIRSLT